MPKDHEKERLQAIIHEYLVENLRLDIGTDDLGTSMKVTARVSLNGEPVTQDHFFVDKPDTNSNY